MSTLFDGLFPSLGPWTSTALWAGLVEQHAPEQDLADELDLITSQRLTPFLSRWLREHDHDQSDAVTKAAHGHAFTLSLRSAQVLARGIDASRKLDAAGIDNAVVKGPAIAASYPIAMDRTFTDVDIYVAPDRFAAAVECCVQTGLTENADSRQPRAFFDRYCREAINLTSPLGANVDIHHHVPPWFWGRRLTTCSVIDRATVKAVTGHDVRCASVEDNLLIAALHVISDKNIPGATLLIWRDLVHLAAGADVETTVARADAVGLREWLASVLHALPEPVRPHQLLSALSRHPGRTRGRRRLGLLLNERAANLGVIATQPLRLPPAHAMAYVGGMLVPSREFAQHKFPNERRPMRSWWDHTLTHHRGRGVHDATS